MSTISTKQTTTSHLKSLNITMTTTRTLEIKYMGQAQICKNVCVWEGRGGGGGGGG